MLDTHALIATVDCWWVDCRDWNAPALAAMVMADRWDCTVIFIHWCRKRKRNSVMADRWRCDCQQAERTEWKHIMACTPWNPQALIAIRLAIVWTAKMISFTGIEIESTSSDCGRWNTQ